MLYPDPPDEPSTIILESYSISQMQTRRPGEGTHLTQHQNQGSPAGACSPDQTLAWPVGEVSFLAASSRTHHRGPSRLPLCKAPSARVAVKACDLSHRPGSLRSWAPACRVVLLVVLLSWLEPGVRGSRGLLGSSSSSMWGLPQAHHLLCVTCLGRSQAFLCMAAKNLPLTAPFGIHLPSP